MDKLAVFFNKNMTVNIKLSSPSAGKPSQVVNQWRQSYPVELHDFPALKVQDFYLVHERGHVNDVLACKKNNGFNTMDAEVAASLPWTSGSLLAAARHALSVGVGISPTSGFHHAGYDSCQGFCSFNALVLVARKLLDEQMVRRVAILDFDMHYGNGCDDIISRFEWDDEIINLTAHKSYAVESVEFFKKLPFLLASIEDVDLVLYQAGADQHIDDPYGGFLTDKQMRLRDRHVFEFLKANNIPVAWNLAGGYQEEVINSEVSLQKVINLHNATLEECMKVYL